MKYIDSSTRKNPILELTSVFLDAKEKLKK